MSRAVKPILIADERGREIAKAAIDRLPLDKPWQITIARHRKKRSLPQNAWLHAMFSTIADETGNDIETVKAFYRDLFLGRVLVRIGDDERMVGRSTTTLKTDEMAELCEKVHAHALAELGIYCPHPDDLGR